MKKASMVEAEVIPRTYGVMKMLAGGRNLTTHSGDLRILEIVSGKPTSRHYHKKSESIFYIQSGDLEMEVEGKTVSLKSGDTIVIEPGEVHLLRNVGKEIAIVIESMAPPYSGKDIFYVDSTEG